MVISDHPVEAANMGSKILVTYASRKGSTKEIAEAIAKELRATGRDVDTMEIASIHSVSGYHAVVIGGPVYMGRVVGDVKKFVGRYRDDLSKIPVAAFTVGLAPVSGEAEAQKIVAALHDSVAPLQPVAETAFAGKLDPEKLSFFQRWITKKVNSPVGDFRNWDAIAQWARALPGKLGAP